MKRLILLIFCLLFFSTSVQAKDSKDVLYQVSTIDALLEGIYDSNYSFKELKKHGNFGIGTVNNLDGELVGINGEFYQVKTDGVAYKVTDKQKTPFAVVTNFKKDKEINIKGKMNYAELTTYLNDKLPTSNIFYAIKIHGTFKTMKTRSVPKQEKPYPPLVEVVKDQSIFNLQNVTGTIIGFKCPSYVKGINVPEYHLHFLSDNKKSGGHILDFEIEKGKAEIDYLTDFFMVLLKTKDFYNVNLDKDKAKELHKVEK